MEQTERYVMEVKEGVFAKWVLWTAGLFPNAMEGNLDEAMVVSDKWLDFKLDRINKSRRTLLLEKYPEIQFRKMKLTFAD